jgi:arsenate reductase (thioredoxin)
MVRSNIRDRRILFLSREDGSLSLIAEAIAKRLLPPRTQVFGASLKGGQIDRKAFQVLGEVGIDVSTQEAKSLDAIPTQDIDLIVMLGERGGPQATVCSRAKCETWDIPDPCQEPRADLDAFRHARDQINTKVGGLFLDYWRNLA